MASISTPSTPLRRRIYSTDSESNAPTGNRSRLPSAEIPRTYSGLYGSGGGAPDDYSDNHGEDNRAHDCNNYDNEDEIVSPPRINSTLSTSSPNNFPRHHYQKGSNLLPFELSRNRNTDWIAAGGPTLLLTYLSFVLIFLLTFLAFFPEPKMAWTLTNVVHGIISLVYLHWVKGNPADYMDGTQGEMNAMTLWEQIVSKPASRLHLTKINRDDSVTTTSANGNAKGESAGTPTVRGQGRDVLIVIPTLLAHASCYIANYELQYAAINVAVWAVIMLPKMPFMNGVRILGINKTAGIDDDFDVDEDQIAGNESELNAQDRSETFSEEENKENVGIVGINSGDSKKTR
ncbi:hypothetical protein ACHAXS_006392 [Conticribra weissflogii]